MSYFVNWQRERTDEDAPFSRGNARQDAAFWRGYNRAKKSQSNFERGIAEGKKAIRRRILLCFEILILVVAVIVILSGCARFVILG